MLTKISQRTAKTGIKKLRSLKKIITNEIKGIIHKRVPEGMHINLGANKPTVIHGKNISFTTPNGDFVSLATGQAEYKIHMGSWQIHIPEGSRAKVIKTTEKSNRFRNGIVTVNSDTSINNKGIIDNCYGRMLVNDGGKINKATLLNTDSRYGLQNYSNTKYFAKGKKTITPGKIDKVLVASSTGEKGTANIINDGIINDLKVSKEYADNVNYRHLTHRGKLNNSNIEIPKTDFYYEPLPGVEY